LRFRNLHRAHTARTDPTNLFKPKNFSAPATARTCAPNRPLKSPRGAHKRASPPPYENVTRAVLSEKKKQRDTCHVPRISSFLISRHVEEPAMSDAASAVERPANVPGPIGPSKIDFWALGQRRMAAERDKPSAPPRPTPFPPQAVAPAPPPEPKPYREQPPADLAVPLAHELEDWDSLNYYQALAERVARRELLKGRDPANVAAMLLAKARELRARRKPKGPIANPAAVFVAWVRKL
jgi:hypothetical protein